MAKVLLRAYKKPLAWGFFLISANVVFGVLGPAYFLHSLSAYAASDNVSVGYGIWLGIGFMINDTMRSLLVHQYWLVVASVSCCFRSIIIGL